MSKEYGIAQNYQAVRLSDAAVLIVAIGQSPNFNTRVTIEQLPWRIYPPHFGLFFETPPVGLPAIRPFVVAAPFPYPPNLKDLVAVDAAGRHEVSIASAFPFASVEKDMTEGVDYVAYRQIGVANCMIAPADAVVPMIYSKAFGPASHRDCVAWVAKHCGG